MHPLREKRAAYALRLLEEGSFAKAVSLYNRMVADDPADTGALRSLGDLHLRLEQHGKAVSAYERIAEHHYRHRNFTESAAVYEQIWMIVARYPTLRPRFAHMTGRLVEALAGVVDVDHALRLVDRLLAAHHDAELARWAAARHLDRASREGATSALAMLRKCFAPNTVDMAATSLLVRAFDQLGQSHKGNVVLKETARIAWRAGDDAVYHALVDALAARDEDTVVELDSRRALIRGEITHVDAVEESVTNVDIPVVDVSSVEELRPGDETPLPLLRRVDEDE
jgi:tetratricopeptide (TPR) repeat protein